MSLIIDLVFIGIILIFAFIGLSRGFIKEIVSLIGVILALVVSFYLSRIFADFIFETFVKDTVVEKISETIVSTAENSVNGVVDVIPEYIVSAAKSMGFDITSSVNNNIASDIESTATSVSTSIVEDVAGPLISGLISVVLFIILFIILKILIGLISKALNLVAKLPVIKSANKLLGFSVGLIRGVLTVVICCYVLTILVNTNDNGLFGITNDRLDSSFILGIYNKIF